MKSYKAQENTKENSYKFTAKERVQQFRNQFFKNITNTGFDNAYTQDRKQWSRLQTQLQNPSQDRPKQKRNHSVINFDKTSKKQTLISNEKLNVQKDRDVSSSVNKRQIKVRKDFDAKVDNISKINDKIFDLLKYVKQRPNTQQEKKPEYNIQSMRTQQLKRIKESLQTQTKKPKFNISKTQKQISTYLDQAHPSQNTATFQFQPIQTNLQTFHRKIYTNAQQDNLENIRQKTESTQYSKSRNKFYQRKTEDSSINKHQRQKYQYYNYQLKQNEMQDKVNVRKTQMLDEINQRTKVNIEYFQNNDRKNEKKNEINTFNYKYLQQPPRQESPQRARKSIGIVKNSPIKQSTKQFTQFSIDNQINKVRSQIQESQNQRQKLVKKYSEYNIQENPKENEKDRNVRKSQLTLSINTATDIEDRVKQPEYQYFKEIPKKIGSSKITTKSIHTQSEDILNSQRKNSSNTFQLKLYPCDNVQKKEAALLAQTLGSQVTHDQKLRQVRQMFACFSNREKWELLKQRLSERKINISVKQLEEQLTISAHEHNPFLKQTQNSVTDLIEQLADIYSKSIYFWQNNLPKCVSKKQLNKESFNVKDIDLQKKGYLSVEDLVCFVNLFSGSFFRNRDFIMVYKRFLKLQSSKRGIQYNTLLDRVSYD